MQTTYCAFLDVESFIVFSKVDAILFSHMTLSDNQTAPYAPITGSKTVNVIALAVDPVRKMLYYSDIQRRSISQVTYRGQTSDIITGMVEYWLTMQRLITVNLHV